MQELLLAVARGLVEDKDAVKVTVDEPREDGTIVYHLSVAEVLEELRSEAGEREYSVCTKEAKNAAKELKKANQEYEKLLAEISGEQRELLEKYMDIVDHAHFQEEQRAYYQGMIDAIQIFEGLGILKKRNKVKELLMHTEK